MSLQFLARPRTAGQNCKIFRYPLRGKGTRTLRHDWGVAVHVISHWTQRELIDEVIRQGVVELMSLWGSKASTAIEYLNQTMAKPFKRTLQGKVLEA